MESERDSLPSGRDIYGMRNTKKIPSKTAKRKTQPKRQSAMPRVAPRYELDDGPLTDEQLDAIRRLQPQDGFKSKKSPF